MKKFIQLLFNKRFKILKNKKGFSLIEVLVAVAIIGIISAIAVPQFTANRNEAARVAGDTSISNIIKAFNNCRVLNGFSSCNTLSGLKVNCPDCDSKTASSPNKFCAHIAKGKDANNPDFAACVSIEESGSSNTVTRTYGGSLLDKVCKYEVAGCTGTNAGSDNKKHPVSPVRLCQENTDCPASSSYSCTSSGTATVTPQLCEASGNTGQCTGTATCG